MMLKVVAELDLPTVIGLIVAPFEFGGRREDGEAEGFGAERASQ
jgi:hypothetical protein